MSYQFDTTRLQTSVPVKAARISSPVRLLARRTIRQNRRATRAI